VTQAGWATLLGYGERTIQRWERGESMPDAAAEEALLRLCQEQGLFRRIDQGPLARVPLSPEWLQGLLTEARLRTAAGVLRLSSPRGGSGEPIPPRASVPAATGNLPLALTSFIGRQREQGDVQQALANTRLLTLTGAGGVGKTRLALEVARGMAAHYRDGVWLVELAALTDPTAVPRTVAAVLRVQELPHESLAATLARALRSRQLLVILDNCEHVVSACAALAERLLQACPELRILATSREPLGIAGERCYYVPSLPAPTVYEPLDRVTQYEAILLFVDRARAVVPTFSVADDNAQAVVEICRRLDGTPLAIELAAARLKVLSVEQIRARLTDRFRLLTGGSRTALPRQKTLRATIAWSYDLLSPAEQQLLRSLAVCRGGCTAAAATVVCDAADDLALLDELTALVDKSLVLRHVDADGEPRFRMLETIREYALEQLTGCDELAAARDRHATAYLALVEPTDQQGNRSRPNVAELAVEHDNLRAALEWLTVHRRSAQAVRLAGALGEFWIAGGHLIEGRRWLEDALACPGGVPEAARAQALYTLGRIMAIQDDYQRSLSVFEESLQLYRQLSHQDGVGRCLNGLGNALAELGVTGQWGVGEEAGKATRAGTLLEEALALFRSLGDHAGYAAALRTLGRIAQAQGALDRAAALWAESLALQQHVGDRLGAAVTLDFLSEARQEQRDYAGARQCIEQSLALRREVGDRSLLGNSLLRLTVSLSAAGEIGSAIALVDEGFQLSCELGTAVDIANWLLTVGGIVGWLGQLEQAARLLGAGEALREARGEMVTIASRNLYARVREGVRRRLGEEAFVKEWAAGFALSLDDAVTLARDVAQKAQLKLAAQ
jgi:non-specific serine/threonine protein kinase